MAGRRPQSNFTHLKTHDEQLVRLGLLAERYFAEDPNTCLFKLRQLTELLAQWVASRMGPRADRLEGEPTSQLLERPGERPVDNSTGLPTPRSAKPVRANAAQTASSA